jgi:hypothetical protein
MPKLDPEAVLFEKALEDVLASSIFQSSRQCQLLLRYVVEHSIAHEDELLRERVIGANVFGRVPDYDTGNDPVVRARAAELRKRLALYYSHADEAQQAIRIEIPTGSYRALFKMAEAHGLGNGRVGNGAEAPLLGNPAVENVAGSSEGHSYDASSPKEKSVAEPVIQIPIINSNTWSGAGRHKPGPRVASANVRFLLVTDNGPAKTSVDSRRRDPWLPSEFRFSG